MDNMEILYIDRESRELREEKIYGRWALSLLYGESIASRIIAFLFLPFLARVPWISSLYGFLQKRPASARKVEKFIKEFNVDPSEFQTETFKSFNDFFIRKLKPEKRPISSDPHSAILPADGRYLVFPDVSRTEQFYIKGQWFDLGMFLRDAPLARRLSSGSMVIGRLCPTDYHRFHFPCSGVSGAARLIEGPLFSVNPVALRKNLSILWENKRMVTEIETDSFGTVFFVEIGATCVGSIHQTFVPDQRIRKGDEKGYFSFGGSCIVLLFEKGTIAFDQDLMDNSAKGIETRALFGTSLGRSLR